MHPIKEKMTRVRGAYSALMQAIDEVVQELERTTGTFYCERPSIRLIQEVVCAHYMVPVQCMASPGRSVAFVRPRHVAMYIAREITPHSLVDIGRCFARDHGSVIWACAAIDKAAETDAKFAKELDALKTSCRVRIYQGNNREAAA